MWGITVDGVGVLCTVEGDAAEVWGCIRGVAGVLQRCC